MNLSKQLRDEIVKICTKLKIDFSYDPKNGVIGFSTDKHGYLEATILDECIKSGVYGGTTMKTAILMFCFSHAVRKPYTSYYGDGDGLNFENTKNNEDWNIDKKYKYVTTFDLCLTYSPDFDRQWCLEMLEDVLHDVFSIRRKRRKSA